MALAVQLCLFTDADNQAVRSDNTQMRPRTVFYNSPVKRISHRDTACTPPINNSHIGEAVLSAAAAVDNLPK